MELKDLRYFVAVAEASGFRRAATHLGVRQSVLSKRVRDLEEELGVSLFERNASGVRLTHAGARFLKEVRTILARIDDASHNARVAGVAQTGKLRLGTVGSISAGLANVVLRQWRVDRPQVDLEMTEASASAHIAAILARELDVALVSTGPVPEGCDSQHLVVERILVAVGTGGWRTLA